jgi:hypothetical protein
MFLLICLPFELSVVWPAPMAFGSAGPLEDVREGWLDFLQTGTDPSDWPPKDGEWINPLDYPVPTLPIDKIVPISPKNGAIWADWFCVEINWPGYVPPPW